MEEHFLALRNAIIRQAVEDYRTAVKILRRNPRNEAAGKLRRDVETFFHTDWFGALMGEMEVDYFMKNLRGEDDEA